MTTTRALAIAAAVLGVLAPIAGSPYTERHASIDVDALAAAVAHEDDHVTAIELGDWIKARRPGLRVVDVRSAEEFAEYHVPTAEHVPLDQVTKTRFRADDTIVLYSEGGPHAAQAWVFLRALGYKNVFFLRGGLYEWLEQVMSPTIAENASPKARAEFDRVAALSRYFGGQPQISDAAASETIPLPKPASSKTSADAAKTSAAVQRIRRRGC